MNISKKKYPRQTKIKDKSPSSLICTEPGQQLDKQY